MNVKLQNYTYGDVKDECQTDFISPPSRRVTSNLYDVVKTCKVGCCQNVFNGLESKNAFFPREKAIDELICLHHSIRPQNLDGSYWVKALQ